MRPVTGRRLGGPLWKQTIRRRAIVASYPVLARLAAVHRRTLARRVRIVVVVGSFGKTTTARATGAVLGVDGRRRHPSHMVLRLRRRDTRAVMEVGIRQRGEMRRFARLVRPDVVVVTSIGSEHNRVLGTLENTRDEKADMVRALPRSGLAVLNGDDHNVTWMATQTRAAVRTFGFGGGCDVRATEVALDGPHGTSLVIHVDGGSCALRVRLVGRHMLYPVLAAVAVGVAEGVALEEACSRVSRVAPSSRRLEPVVLEDGTCLLRDEYKAGVETIDAALDVMAATPDGGRIVVLGDIEEPPADTVEGVEAIYERLGARVAASGTAAVFVHLDVGEPRPTYAPGALAAGMSVEAVTETSTVLETIEAVRARLRPGDVVLVKGSAQQKLDRIALALAGRDVRCNLPLCIAPVTCEACPMLERGWEGEAVPLRSA
jgi:UDP-N-acetylmuramyl pentapeptide synthase